MFHQYLNIFFTQYLCQYQYLIVGCNRFPAWFLYQKVQHSHDHSIGIDHYLINQKNKSQQSKPISSTGVCRHGKSIGGQNQLPLLYVDIMK